MLTVGAGGGGLDIFTLIYHFYLLSPSLWETARYRLKYCLKGPLKGPQNNQPTLPSKGGRRVLIIRSFKKMQLLLVSFLMISAEETSSATK